MKNQKTPTKTVRVQDGINFLMPAPDPSIIGYVVRYEHGGVDGGLSEPLKLDCDYEPTGILLISPGDPSTIFSTFEQAKHAVIASIKYRRKHGFRWNKMYGDYLIAPVVAR